MVEINKCGLLEMDEKKKIKIKNALQSGEKVVMVRQQGGQKYMVLDRCEEG